MQKKKNMAVRTNYKKAATEAPPLLLHHIPTNNDNPGIIAYAYHTQNKGPPTVVQESGDEHKFVTWEEYQEYISSLRYPLKQWATEHDKFMVASKAATALGRGSGKSMYQLWCELSRHSCCPPSNPGRPRDRFLEYMLARGLRFEPFIRTLYLTVLNEPNITIRECTSTIHPVHRWLMATPDGIVIDTVAQKAIRTVEWKAPYKRDAFLEIPDDYMVQIQLTMAVTGSTECDFGSFKVMDRDFSTSEFIVHRVYRNDDFINEAIRVLDLFCYSVCAKCRPPSVDEFCPKSRINSSMILRLTDVVALVPNGDAILRNAIRMANQDADNAVRGIPK